MQKRVIFGIFVIFVLYFSEKFKIVEVFFTNKIALNLKNYKKN